jgi:hypothetical protein
VRIEIPAFGTELRAQDADRRIHRVAARELVDAVDVVLDLLAQDRVPAAEREVLEQRVLARGEVERVAANDARRATTSTTSSPTVTTEDRFLVAPAHERADAGEELLEREGFTR